MPLTRNRLLRALPPEELASVWPRLEAFNLALRESVFTRGSQIEFVLFPETGWVSDVVVLENGDACEVGLIGREGMIGLPLIYGDNISAAEHVIQCPGEALRISADAFRSALEEMPALRSILLRYALAFYAQVAHNAACNLHHNIKQRLARWLLMAHDRAEGDRFMITHEFLSQMLGVRRAGVTIAAMSLQRGGFIRYERGTIQIVDRPSLESASCACYACVRKQYDRLVGLPS
jgi:CRP-like cAMP-binding protein